MIWFIFQAFARQLWPLFCRSRARVVDHERVRSELDRSVESGFRTGGDSGGRAQPNIVARTVQNAAFVAANLQHDAGRFANTKPSF